MTGDAFELKVKHANTQTWFTVCCGSFGGFYQSEYTVERDKEFYEFLGLETKLRKFKTEYADEG